MRGRPCTPYLVIWLDYLIVAALLRFRFRLCQMSACGNNWNITFQNPWFVLKRNFEDGSDKSSSVIGPPLSCQLHEPRTCKSQVYSQKYRLFLIHTRIPVHCADIDDFNNIETQPPTSDNRFLLSHSNTRLQWWWARLSHIPSWNGLNFVWVWKLRKRGAYCEPARAEEEPTIQC